MGDLAAARHIAELLNARLQRPRIAVRSSFIVSSDPDTPPPMTLMLRGGRGGEVKLKLLLSMLWVAVREPYDVSQPARVWAELIGLDEPETKGAARVNAAIRRLVEGGFLAAERRPGNPSRLFLREETGSGAPYSHPGSHWITKKAKKDKDAPRYTQLPATLWLNGWIAALSAPALAMLLILLEQTRGKTFEGLWFAPSVAAKRYKLSETTRRKGIDELVQLNLVFVDRVPIGRGTLGAIRERNTFTVNLPRLEEHPEDNPEILRIVSAGVRPRRRASVLEDRLDKLAATTVKPPAPADNSRKP
ncbi:hypothetical protein ABS642_10445 [Microbacterium sp. A8/3-1]|uniref:Helix-turn-helix domain-containing protein n=1 Tax=Microbacterium sp. A8/3-1 TaxID=3160749 RepID=A0AAU7W219_9MICO